MLLINKTNKCFNIFMLSNIVVKNFSITLEKVLVFSKYKY